MRLTVTRSLIFASALGIGVFHGYLKTPPEDRDVEPVRDYLMQATAWQGRYAPAVELTLLDGSTFSMAEEVGRSVIVLNFWATWCAPCREEMPELQRFVDAHRDDPLRFVAVDADEAEETVRAYLAAAELHLPVAIDDDNQVGERFAVSSYPTTVVIGAEGRVVLYEAGAILNADVSLEGLVQRELERIRSGAGTSREDYLAGLADQPPMRGVRELETEPKLEGRALHVAEIMTCPCGCSDKVAECGCDTADRITTALLDMDLTGRDDADVIRELNARFCVGGTG